MMGSRSVRQQLFGIYLKRSSQYKKQSFVIIRCADDATSAFWLGKVLLPLRLRKASCGTVSGEKEAIFNVQFKSITEPISSVEWALGCVFLWRLCRMCFTELCEFPATMVRTILLLVNTTAHSLSAQFFEHLHSSVYSTTSMATSLILHQAILLHEGTTRIKCS